MTTSSRSRTLPVTGPGALVRIHGIGPEFAAMLAKLGIDGLAALAASNGDDLHTKLVEMARSSGSGRRPSLRAVRGWVTEAAWRLGGQPRETPRPPEESARIALAPHPERMKEFEVTRAILDLISEAAEVFGSTDEALTWLNTPNVALGGNTPANLFRAGVAGVHEARSLLMRLEEGVYS